MSALAEPDRLLFDDTLVSDDEFPVSLRTARSPRECSDAARRAEITLRAIMAIEDYHEDSDAHLGGEHVNARVEAKVDLALGLLGMIAAQQHMSPATRRVRWSRRGMRLSNPEPLTAGSLAICSAHLISVVPLPVEVPLEVVACEPAGNGFELWLKVPDSAPALRDGLERELFRRHRRMIAEQRAAR